MMTKKLAGCLAAAAAAVAVVGAAPADAKPVDGAQKESSRASSVCLYRLYADVTEDTSVDEPYLGLNPGIIWGPKPMEAGTYRTVKRRVAVGAEVWLYDEDSPDGDDPLGNHQIWSVSGSVDVYNYTWDGARYRLSVRPSSYCS